MKLHTMNFVSILILLSFFCFVSCDYSVSTDDISNSEDYNIPQLLERSDKTKLGKEWDYVQNFYQERSKQIINNPKNVEAKIELAQLFIKEARVTGEHGHYYPSALSIIDQVLKSEDLSSDNKFLSLMTKAGVQLSLHEFSDALVTGTEAVRLNPNNAQIHGVLVDCHVELGNYEKAVELADRMISIKPDIRSYSRVSYIREIYGDVQGSIDALTLAVKSGYPGYEETAWAMQTLAELHMQYGETEKAESIFNQILDMRPDYPFAVAGLGDVAYEKGDLRKAETTYNEAISIIPEVSFYISLAKIYKDENRSDELLKIKSEILEMLEDDVIHGHNMNMEYAFLYNDIFEDPESALTYIKEEYSKRPENIDVNRIMAEVSFNLKEPNKVMQYLAAANKTKSQNPELIAMQQKLEALKNLSI